MTVDQVELTRSPIDVGRVLSGISDPECGAQVLFLGTVRGVEDGERIEYLEYEAYEEMAREELFRLCQRLRARWPEIRKVAIVHRLGRVGVGEAAVLIALSAPHREGTFPALAYAVKELKETVPIWKKEVGEKGARWKPAK
ncbi:TPA: hypothetical protein DCL37_03910 [Candidatus Acetothermia bacterium]|nr:molybdenum cofactor biosynthesis protein MoaE [Candidatus Bipolaricaulota bacterium]HAF70487.1 hypothetical protein [Candidatus Acetothermia bacterium]